MSPAKHGPSPGKNARALDRAVKKLEAKEAEQDAKTGKKGKPVNSVGREIHRGWKERA